MDQENYDYQENLQEQFNYAYEDDQYIQQQSNIIYQDYQNYGNINQNKQYQIIPYNSLFTQLLKNIKNTQEMTTLSEGWCLLLLRQFKWDIESLAQYFHNMQIYQSKIGYKLIYKNPNLIINHNNGYCQVCCASSVILFQNICGHGFCLQCWKSHLSLSLNNNEPFVKCMTCTCPVLKQLIIDYLNICYPDDRKFIDKYQKILCQLFSLVHRNYQFCTGLDCNNCIKVYNLNLTTVRCTCNKTFCFKCKSDDHSPCLCDQKKKWLQTVLKQQADAKWMSVNTKLCPWCKKAVQRSAGCNFMACICGKSFCYLCSRPWQPDHKDHFKCHIYKKSQNQQINRQKQILQKMNFYTQRFLDNQKTAQQIKKIEIFQKRKYLFKTLKIDLSDSQFIDFSYKFSIQCCQTLKWINTYSFYKKWKNQLDKQQFEFYQGQFERYKVNLLKLLAVDLKKFFKQIQRQQKQFEGQINQIIRQALINDFKYIKSNIVNYTTMTKKYKQKFLQEIQRMPQFQQKITKKISNQMKQERSINSKTLARNQNKIQNKNSLTGKIVKYFKN